MKTLILTIAALAALAALATPCLAQNHQYTVTKQGNLTTIYDTQRHQSYYFYDTTPPADTNQGQLLPTPPAKSSGSSVADLLNVPAKDRWMYDD